MRILLFIEPCPVFIHHANFGIPTDLLTIRRWSNMWSRPRTPTGPQTLVAPRRHRDCQVRPNFTCSPAKFAFSLLFSSTFKISPRDGSIKSGTYSLVTTSLPLRDMIALIFAPEFRTALRNVGRLLLLYLSSVRLSSSVVIVNHSSVCCLSKVFDNRSPLEYHKQLCTPGSSPLLSTRCSQTRD
jgi:hypothetical protein